MRPARAQRGAATILAVIFLVISVSLMVVAALNMAGSDITDTALNHDAIEALFIAESGVERAAQAYASGTPCLGLAPVGPIAFGAGEFQVTAANDTDFVGAPLPASQCRIEVLGQAGPRTAARRIEVILQTGGNLLASNNADFNNPVGTPGPPTGWTLPPGGWHDSGGPDGSRSAYVVKPFNGPSEVTTAGAYSITTFTVTAPTLLNMSFDYRVTNGNSPQEMQLSFQLRDSNGNTYSHAQYQSGSTSGYVTDSVDINIPGTGSITITVLEFELIAKAGQAKQLFLDNLVLTDPAGSGGSIKLLGWHEPVQ